MKNDTAKPIPTPLRQRLRDARLRILPGIVLIAAIAGLATMWRGYFAAPMLVGQAEVLQTSVSSYKSGTVAQLTVSRFQKVKAGDVVGQVLVTDPKILASSLAVIQADIEMMRVNMRPTTEQQRTVMDYYQLRLAWMRERAQLALTRNNLTLAETDLQRKQELFQDKIVSERTVDEAKTARDRLKAEQTELATLVEEQGKGFELLQATNANDITKISELPLNAAIAVQEAKLRLTEAELAPVILQASVDGVVSMVFHRSGEAILAGEPILSVAASTPMRIISYIRPPIGEEPRVGARVEIRTRGNHRQVGMADIVEVGAQFENVAPALQSPIKLANQELGLPIGISLPPNLKIRPGELVDISLLPEETTDNSSK